MMWMEMKAARQRQEYKISEILFDSFPYFTSMFSFPASCQSSGHLITSAPRYWPVPLHHGAVFKIYGLGHVRDSTCTTYHYCYGKGYSRYSPAR